MAKISKVWAREILDSRGIPTIEAACQVDTGHIAVASVPAGTSTGSNEALELRDNDQNRYHGKGVLKAVENVNSVLGPSVAGMEVTDQASIDKKLIELDSTENKSKYGANSILSVSISSCKAAAASSGQHLYYWINSLAKNLGLNANIHIPAPELVLIEGG
ncbi:MAG: phosphopyruvate hydratase, partial [Candidatus Woesebacteria bacterium]